LANTSASWSYGLNPTPSTPPVVFSS
jgi:hypothetical protein